jgi:hypothetical protein
MPQLPQLRSHSFRAVVWDVGRDCAERLRLRASMLTIPAISAGCSGPGMVSSSNNMPMHSAALACPRSSLAHSVTSSIARRSLCILLRDRRTLRALSTMTRRPIDEKNRPTSRASRDLPPEMIFSNAVRSSRIPPVRCRVYRAGRLHPLARPRVSRKRNDSRSVWPDRNRAPQDPRKPSPRHPKGQLRARQPPCTPSDSGAHTQQLQGELAKGPRHWPCWPAACTTIWDALSVMYITDSMGSPLPMLGVCFGKVKGEACSN